MSLSTFRSWVGLIALTSWLFAQLVMTGLFAPDAESLRARLVDGFPGDGVAGNPAGIFVICTSSGIVVVGPDGEPIESPKRFGCSWCQVAGSAAAPEPCPVPAPPARFADIGIDIPVSGRAGDAGLAGLYLSRAPPV